MGSKYAAVWETLRTVIYAVLFAIGLRTFAYEPFSIPSSSMVPTLLIGDYLFVSKFSYGYSRFSFPLSIDLFDGRVFDSLPERGDVAVFRSPADLKQDWIKRLIGMPGDRIQMRDGSLYINDELIARERLPDTVSPNGARVQQYRETLPNGRSYIIYEADGNRARADNTTEIVVPPGHYFMMGDNRDRSQDSRFDGVGTIPFENFIGRAEFLFFSRGQEHAWWELWNVRFSRILNSID